MTFPSHPVSTDYAPPPMIPQRRGAGCVAKALFIAVGLLAVVIVTAVATRGGTPATALSGHAAVVVANAPAPTAAPVVVNADLAHLQETGAALDNDQKRLDITATSQAIAVVQAAIDQQAENARKQAEYNDRVIAITEAVGWQGVTATAAMQTATAVVKTNDAVFWSKVTSTASVLQATQAVETETARQSTWRAEANSRWWSERLAGIWMPMLAITVMALLYATFLVARGFGRMLEGKYSQPQAIMPERYSPDSPGITGDDTPPYLSVFIPEGDGSSGRWAQIRVRPENLLQFAIGVINQHIPVAEGYWTGDGKLFAQSKYDLFRDDWIAENLGRWNNPRFPKQGWSLTHDGAAALMVQAFPVQAPHSPSVVDASNWA